MNYKKFTEVENVRRAKTLELAKAIDYRGKWQITEKIHGSNLGILIDLEGNIRFATRNDFLVDDQNHYNHKRVILEKIRLDPNKVLNALREVLSNKFNDYTEFCIFGEIFGGMYNSPEVPANPKAIKVQKGISYSPDNEFMAFDVMLLRALLPEEIQDYRDAIERWKQILSNTIDPTRKDEINNVLNGLYKLLKTPKGEYLSVDDCKSVCKLAGIPIVPEIGIYDKLSDALAVDPVFESRVYEMYGLPKIPDNFAEGLVIRPCEELYHGNGERVILKNKNPKFDEISKSPKVKAEEPKEIACAEETKILLEKVADYTNTNRLDAVLSKMAGPFSSKSYGAILKDFNEDVLKDFDKDYESEIETVKTLGEYKILTKAVAINNGALLKTQILNIIDYGHTV